MSGVEYYTVSGENTVRQTSGHTVTVPKQVRASTLHLSCGAWPAAPCISGHPDWPSILWEADTVPPVRPRFSPQSTTLRCPAGLAACQSPGCAKWDSKKIPVRDNNERNTHPFMKKYKNWSAHGVKFQGGHGFTAACLRKRGLWKRECT